MAHSCSRMVNEEKKEVGQSGRATLVNSPRAAIIVIHTNKKLPLRCFSAAPSAEKAIKHEEKNISPPCVAMRGFSLLHVDSWEGDKGAKGKE